MACRKEGGSFLIFKIRLRVIHKKRKREKEEGEYGKPYLRGRVRERGSTFSLDFPTIGP